MKPGEVFDYFIQVDHNVTAARAVTLEDSLPGEVEAVKVLNVAGGSCALNGRELRCSLTPMSGRPSMVTVQVKVANAAPGSTISNSATVTDPGTGAEATGTISVLVEGGSSTPSPTATPLPPTATPLPPTATAGPSSPTATTLATATVTDPTATPSDEPHSRPSPVSNPPGREPDPTDTSAPGPTPVPVTSGQDPTPVQSEPEAETSTTAPGEPEPATATTAPNEPTAVPAPSSEAAPPTTTQAPAASARPTTPSRVPAPSPVQATRTPVAPVPPSIPAAGDGGSGQPGTSRTGYPTLSFGSQGPAVRDLQTRLNTWIALPPRAGLRPLVVDGTFGPATGAAVRAFQRAVGLAPDGVVGPQTWARLDALPAGPPVSSPVPHPSHTAAAQPLPGTPVEAVRGTTAPTAERASVAPPAPTATMAPSMPPMTTPLAPSAPADAIALRFNIRAGADSARAGDLIIYTITLQHAGRGSGGSAPQPASNLGGRSGQAPLDGGAIENLVVADELPAGLEPVAVHGVGVSVRTRGRTIEALRARLAPGETVVVVVGARVKSDIGLPALLNQASVRYGGRANAVYSNVVQIGITGLAARPAAATAPTVASVAAAAVTPSPATVPTSAAQPVPSAVAQVDVIAAGGASTVAAASLGDQLPRTSGGGVPLGGLTLLGLTLLARGLRARCERRRPD